MNKRIRRILAIIIIIVLVIIAGYINKENIIMSFNKQLDKETKEVMKKKLSFMDIKNIVFSKKDLTNFKQQIKLADYEYANQEYYDYFNEIAKPQQTNVVSKTKQYVKEKISLNQIKIYNQEPNHLKVFKRYLENGVFGDKNTFFVINADSNVTIANKDRFIYDYEPQDLINLDMVPRENNKETYLATKESADALDKMCLAMEQANNKDCGGLVITSAYRSYGEQRELYNEMVSEDSANVKLVNKAGESEHQLGNSIDISVKNQNNRTFNKSVQYRWLQYNAADYGFILRYPKDKEKTTGISYEPWHYRYVGVELAQKLKSSNQTMEEYYDAAYQ